MIGNEGGELGWWGGGGGGGGGTESLIALRYELPYSLLN